MILIMLSFIYMKFLNYLFHTYTYLVICDWTNMSRLSWQYYNTSVSMSKIPIAAVTVEHAQLMQRYYDNGN
jgi:hypothetical protein